MKMWINIYFLIYFPFITIWEIISHGHHLSVDRWYKSWKLFNFGGSMICYNWSPGEEPRPSILIPLGCGQRQKQNNMINNTATSLAKIVLQLKSEQQPAPQLVFVVTSPSWRFVSLLFIFCLTSAHVLTIWIMGELQFTFLWQQHPAFVHFKTFNCSSILRNWRTLCSEQWSNTVSH